MVSKTIVVGSIPTVPANFISYIFMNLESKIFEYLKNQNIRITKHIQSVISVILYQKTPIDAKNIYQKLIFDKKFINLSTIHRILDRLHKVKLLESLYGEKSNFYELSSSFLPHHHHFTCIKCGSIIDMDKCIINPILESISDIGQPISHFFEIKGICNKCK